MPKDPSKRIQKNHPKSQIIGDKSARVETRRKLILESEQEMFSMVEPKPFSEVGKNEDWIKEMNEELDQIEKNQT